MANNRMHFVCNVCLPEGEDPKDYDHWREVSFHVAKWYPGDVGGGAWYTQGGDWYSDKLDNFFLAHEHQGKYPGGVENPVRLEYEWTGTPIKPKE